jgi:hypothetical protein
MRSVWICLCSLMFSLAASAQFAADDARTACLHQVQVVSADGFVFKAYKNDAAGDACLQVSRAGRVIFRRTLGNDGSYTLGQHGDEYGPAIPDGKDITGRGYPNMLVSFYTGGAHCCLLYYVFELAPRFRLITTLDAEDGDASRFQLIDGKYYFVGADWTFSYWRTSFMDSPAPSVTLGFVDDPSGGTYHLALDKMNKPAPTPREWTEALSQARDAFGQTNPFSDEIGSELWRRMLDFIYEGHSGLAWTLFNESWPVGRKGKNKFLADFCSQLKTSPYWHDLKDSIPNMPANCAKAPPRDE